MTQELSRKISCKLFKEDNIKGLMKRVKQEVEESGWFYDVLDVDYPRCGANGEDILPKTNKGFTPIDGEIEITIRKF